MTDAVLAEAPRVRSFADRALKSSGVLWFLIAAAGQWVFVFYIAAFYYGPTLQGHFAAWNRKDLITGYVAGDNAGNLAFAMHVLMAALITAGGTLQLVPQIRARAPSFHRWNGRLFILTAILMASGGLWMVWVRGTQLSLVSAIGSSLNAMLILVCAAMTLRFALARRIDAHQRWAMRTFLVVNGVWFLRVGIMFWIIVNKGPVGMSDKLDGPFDTFWVFGNFLLPLAIYELYLHVGRSTRRGGKVAMAAALSVLAMATGVGIFGAFMFLWKPYMLM